MPSSGCFLLQCVDMLLTPERSEQSEMEHESSSLKQDVAFFTEDRAATLLTRMVHPFLPRHLFILVSPEDAQFALQRFRYALE